MSGVWIKGPVARGAHKRVRCRFSRRRRRATCGREATPPRDRLAAKVGHADERKSSRSACGWQRDGAVRLRHLLPARHQLVLAWRVERVEHDVAREGVASTLRAQRLDLQKTAGRHEDQDKTVRAVGRRKIRRLASQASAEWPADERALAAGSRAGRRGQDAAVVNAAWLPGRSFGGAVPVGARRPSGRTSSEL